MKKIAVIGGGLCGLTAAIRLRQAGFAIELFESAPQLGGRTRSFFEPTRQQWVDYGPHLLIGAYQATQQLMNDVQAKQNIHWQSALELPLWDASRGHFALTAKAWLPFPLALVLAISRLPGHDIQSIAAIVRLAMDLQRSKKTVLNRQQAEQSVQAWLHNLHIPSPLLQDMLEPLCLGAMNEGIATANAASFKTVLDAAFANHAAARLGWFNKPLQQALIEPLAHYAQHNDINIHTTKRIRSLAIRKKDSNKAPIQLISAQQNHDCDAVVLALTPSARDNLFGLQGSAQASHVPSKSITNIHMWFEQEFRLAAPLIGALASYGQWFFDISAQHHTSNGTHICAIISADENSHDQAWKLDTVLRELRALSGLNTLNLQHHRVITTKAATYQVSMAAKPQLPKNIIDACEQPQPGQFPATIESAVLRGEAAAAQLIQTLT